MERTIVLDQFYLNAFIRSGIRSGIFRIADFNEEYRNSSKGYSRLSALLHEVLLLFDNVHFVSDPAFDLNFRLDDLTLLPYLAIALRLKHFFDGVDGPARFVQGVEDMRAIDVNECQQVAEQITNERGLSLSQDELFNDHASSHEFRRIIPEMIKQSPQDRELPNFIIQTWPLVPRYLKRKVPYTRRIPLSNFAFFVNLYLRVPYPNLPDIIRRTFPSVPSDKEAIDSMMEIISLLEYTSWQVAGILEDATKRGGISALAVARGKKQPQLDDTPFNLVRLLISRLGAEGLIIPDLINLKSALRLRDDPRIVDFRKTLWQWTDLVRSGEITESQKVASEVAKANKALRNIGTYRKINDWFLYLSLPGLLVDALLSMPAFGAVFGLAGLGLKYAERNTTTDVKWLLLLHDS